MKFKKLCLSALALACATLILVSCASLTIRGTSGSKRGYGPPPHAPAHGHRYKHQGVELVYDSGRGVYIVVGLPHHYYYKGSYYRLSGDQWQMSVHIEGKWEPVSEKSLPPGLQAKKKGKGKPK